MQNAFTSAFQTLEPIPMFRATTSAGEYFRLRPVARIAQTISIAWALSLRTSINFLDSDEPSAIIGCVYFSDDELLLLILVLEKTEHTRADRA